MHISLLLWIVNHGGVSVDYQNISDDRHSSYYTKLSFQKKKLKKIDAVETFSGEVSLIKSAGWRKRGWEGEMRYGAQGLFSASILEAKN